VADVYFLSSNEHKISEAQAILDPLGFTVRPLTNKIEELQTTDVPKLARDKALRAFHQVGRPLFVEHTSLHLPYLNGFPGGLTQVFWDSLEADRFSEIFGNSTDRRVTARTTVCFVDGRNFHMYEGEAQGQIAPEPRGPKDFQWDCVFVPDGYEQTYAELGDEKNAISMRAKAFRAFAADLAVIHGA
jgi:XTP/dITP diphosphohydrolase